MLEELRDAAEKTLSLLRRSDVLRNCENCGNWTTAGVCMHWAEIVPPHVRPYGCNHFEEEIPF